MIAHRFGTRSELRLRFLLCLGAVALVFGVLVVRLLVLQVVQGSRYRYLSENNRIRVERLVAPRGMILDRRGEVLADVRASFDALVVPAELPKGARGAVEAELVQALGLAPGELTALLNGPGPPRWKGRLLRRNISRPELARLAAHRLELPGVLIRAVPVRHYPHQDLLGGLLGYVGEISGRELRLPPYAEYESGDILGRAGVEAAWEQDLRGEAGGQQVEVDVRGRTLGVLAERSPRPGSNLILTIDRRLQAAAAAALGEEAGSIVVVAVHTGDVLALVSQPSVDPNHLARKMDKEQWEAIASDPRHPLQDRATQGVYPPGSTFKIATALAGLDRGVITPQTRVFCGGEYHFAGRPYRCWKKGGHGTVDLDRAMAESCDVFFYQTGLDLGIDALFDGASQLGFGQATGIGLPGEREGLVPSKGWKRKARKEPWYAGETLSVAIGQSYVLSTPVQLAAVLAGVAHPQGIRMRPRLVSRIEDPEGRHLRGFSPQEAGRLAFRRAHLDRIRHGLRLVVGGDAGTGRKAEVAGFPVAGKTGTAQVVRLPAERNLRLEDIPWERRDHALFAGYAPADRPEIAFAVVVEHGGGGGSVAAPMAGLVVEAYQALKAVDAGVAEGGP